MGRKNDEFTRQLALIVMQKICKVMNLASHRILLISKLAYIFGFR